MSDHDPHVDPLQGHTGGPDPTRRPVDGDGSTPPTGLEPTADLVDIGLAAYFCGEPADTESTATAPTTPERLGDYRILRKLGGGAMGIVYLAEEGTLSRRVALKVLKPELNLSPDAVRRFRIEAASVARLRHPGIARVFAVGQAEGQHFIAMELIEGSPLNEVIGQLRAEGLPALDGSRVRRAVSQTSHRVEIDSSEPVDAEPAEWDRTYIETVCRIVTQIADALQHAHDAGVVHRDVKPSNILVLEDGTAILTDFGLARTENLPSITKTEMFVGTPQYVSPEQARARKGSVDHRTDIFSLGVTLYEMLTLRLPFVGVSSIEVLEKVLHQEPPNPRRLNRKLPRDLVTILLKALEKDPRRRYANAGAFAADLRAFLAMQPISARRASPLTRIAKFVRRHRAAAAASTLIVAGLIAKSMWDARQPGTLSVTSLDGATLIVARGDAPGTAYGPTPLRAPLSLPAGEYWLHLEKIDGERLLVSGRQRVPVKANTETPVALDHFDLTVVFTHGERTSDLAALSAPFRAALLDWLRQNRRHLARWMLTDAASSQVQARIATHRDLDPDWDSSRTKELVTMASALTQDVAATYRDIRSGLTQTAPREVWRRITAIHESTRGALARIESRFGLAVECRVAEQKELELKYVLIESLRESIDDAATPIAERVDRLVFLRELAPAADLSALSEGLLTALSRLPRWDESFPWMQTIDARHRLTKDLSRKVAARNAALRAAALLAAGCTAFADNDATSLTEVRERAAAEKLFDAWRTLGDAEQYLRRRQAFLDACAADDLSGAHRILTGLRVATFANDAKGTFANHARTDRDALRAKLDAVCTRRLAALERAVLAAAKESIPGARKLLEDFKAPEELQPRFAAGLRELHGTVARIESDALAATSPRLIREFCNALADDAKGRDQIHDQLQACWKRQRTLLEERIRAGADRDTRLDYARVLLRLGETADVLTVLRDAAPDRDASLLRGCARYARWLTAATRKEADIVDAVADFRTALHRTHPTDKPGAARIRYWLGTCQLSRLQAQLDAHSKPVEASTAKSKLSKAQAAMLEDAIALLAEATRQRHTARQLMMARVLHADHHALGPSAIAEAIRDARSAPMALNEDQVLATWGGFAAANARDAHAKLRVVELCDEASALQFQALASKPVDRAVLEASIRACDAALQRQPHAARAHLSLADWAAAKTLLDDAKRYGDQSIKQEVARLHAIYVDELKGRKHDDDKQ